MMTFEGAVVKEQNVTFAIVAVEQHVVDNSAEANRLSHRRVDEVAIPILAVNLAAKVDRRDTVTL